MPKSPKSTTVIDFIEHQLSRSKKTRLEIAQECGFDNPDTITLISMGRAKLPLKSVAPLAKALDADPAHLLRLTMMEYTPELWEAVEENLSATTLTINEMNLVKAFREVTGHNDATPVVIDRDAVLAIVMA